MIFFQLVHEIAVVGTSFLMVGLGTLWYAAFTETRSLSAPHVSPDPKLLSTRSTVVFEILVSCVSYAVVLGMVAFLIAITPVLTISWFTLLLGCWAFAIALLALACVYDSSLRSNFLVHSGFLVVFIIGGGCIIRYWPW